MAAALGAGALVLPLAGASALGLPLDRRSAWALRLFGVRELVLAFGLDRAARSGNRAQADLMADLVGAAQVGDMALALALLARGSFSRRAALIVWIGAVPTLVAIRAGRPARSRRP